MHSDLHVHLHFIHQCHKYLAIKLSPITICLQDLEYHEDD